MKKLQKTKIVIHLQVEITNVANPGVTIQIGKKRSLMDSPTKGAFEYLMSGNVRGYLIIGESKKWSTS